MEKETTRAINTLAGAAGRWVGWNFSLLLKLLAVVLIAGTASYAALHGRAPFAMEYTLPLTRWEYALMSLGWISFGFSAGGDFAKWAIRRHPRA